MKLTLLFSVFWVASAISAPKLTFHQSKARYLAGHDLFRILQQKFPAVDFDAALQCSTLYDQNRAALGESNPVNGEATYPGPSSAFVKWYTRCLRQSIDKQYAAIPDGNLLWAGVDKGQQLQEILQLIHHFIGPGVHPDESSLLTRIHAATLAGAVTRTDAIKKAALLVTLDEAFFTY